MTMTRRSVMGGAVAGGLGAAALGIAEQGGAAAQPAAKQDKPACFVLVHGAWHGGWCWRLIRDALIAEGHRVFTPTLTGLGERSHLLSPNCTLSLHMQDVVNAMEWEEVEDAILVGHSYGGAVITLAADRLRGSAPQRLKHLVYLDAVIGEDNKPFTAVMATAPDDGRPAIRSEPVDGWRLPAPPAAMFGVPESLGPLHDWVQRRLTDHPLPTLTEAVPFQNGGIAGLPASFVLCTAKEGFNGFAKHAETAQAMGMAYHELATGHDAMVSDPDGVLAILRALA